MFVINSEDRIEYNACSPEEIEHELVAFFEKAAELRRADLSALEVFFYAAQIHLVFVKIHPLPDGNGRTGLLLEKWFLIEKLGQDAASVELERNYFKNRDAYYQNLRVLGLEYQDLDFSKALPFFLMAVNSLK